MEAVLFIGVQGSGKTSFYKERFFETHIRISRDMLKTPHRETLLLAACLEARQPFVVDNTNALTSQRAQFIEPAKAAGFRVVGFFFLTELSQALRRNRQRPADRVIPAAGVAATYKRLRPPSRSEGFDEIFLVEIDKDNQFVVRPWEGRGESPPVA